MAKSARPRNFVGVSSRVFLTGEILPRSEICNFKNQQRRFSVARIERKLPDLDVGFSLCSQKYF